MKNSKLLFVLALLLLAQLSQAQKEIDLAQYSFTMNSLEDEAFTQLMNEKLDNSRFVFVGEQHGIKSAATVTSQLYSLGQAYGYNTLCLETDDLNAQKLQEMAAGGNFNQAMKTFNEQFEFSIPFFSNADDHVLFDNVQVKGGQFWGIDQTFIMQFRYNLGYLANNTKSDRLKKLATKLSEDAEAAFVNTLETKDPKAPYLFQFNEENHKGLLEAATTLEEKEIIRQLWKTKEIYEYYFKGKSYQNNEVRGHLMKSNFMRYWNKAIKEGSDPKVIFKLGANHAARGLTRTNIYDIANLGSELAISRGEESVHVAVLGLKGKAATGNPFAPSPVIDFDNTQQLPEEVQKLVAELTDRYFVMDLESLRDYGYGKRFSEDFKKTIFQYDVLILVNGAEAVRSF